MIPLITDDRRHDNRRESDKRNEKFVSVLILGITVACCLMLWLGIEIGTRQERAKRQVISTRNH